ncbi:MAG: FeoA family protein [Polyangiaceae bacterium]
MTANTTSFTDALVATSESAPSQTSAEAISVGDVSLASLGMGKEGIVHALTLEPELAAWLRAVGIGEGDRVSVLRAGAFGGPLHVRNAQGGEFALNRQLARSVLVKRG